MVCWIMVTGASSEVPDVYNKPVFGLFAKSGQKRKSQVRAGKVVEKLSEWNCVFKSRDTKVILLEDSF